MIFPDGTMYNGDFKDGKIEGHGIMQYANGDRFIGLMKDDQKDGNGVWHDAAKHTKRQGTWAKDKRTAWIGPETTANITQHGQLDLDGETFGRDERSYLNRPSAGGKWRNIVTAPKLKAARQFRAAGLLAKGKNSNQDLLSQKGLSKGLDSNKDFLN